MSANRIESNEYPMNIILKLCHASIVYELLSVRSNKVINTGHNTPNKDSKFKQIIFRLLTNI